MQSEDLCPDLRSSAYVLNTDKSKFMLFHKKRTPPESYISINNSDIERVSQFTFLGIVLDKTLSWKNHITMITNKLSRIKLVLHRLKFIFQKNILLTILKSLFVPHINYGHLFEVIILKPYPNFKKEQFEQLHIVITLRIQSPYLNN